MAEPCSGRARSFPRTSRQGRLWHELTVHCATGNPSALGVVLTFSYLSTRASLYSLLAISYAHNGLNRPSRTGGSARLSTGSSP